MDKEYLKLFHALAAWFLIREEQANHRKDYGAAVAYANAYDLLCYTIDKNKDCLMQFDDMDKAVQFAFEHRDAPARDLEEIFKKERDRRYKKMWDYWFFNNESGEEFFVECATEEEAWEIVEENDLNDGNLEIVQVVTPEEAERVGLDTF